MFDRVLNQPLGYYVWELVFGKFNLFFKKFIHQWEMFIVEFLLATDLQSQKKKNFVICNYRLFTLFWLFSLFPNSINENCELYFCTYCIVARYTQWCYKAVMLATLQYTYANLFCFCYPSLPICLLHLLSRFSIGTLSSLAFFTFFWQEDKFNIYMIYVECYFLIALPWPILEFKGSVRDVQKGHPTFVSQVDLIPYIDENLKY